jgi:hypothetical protein
MSRKPVYEIFEKLPDRSVVSRGAECELQAALAKMTELAWSSKNEFLAIHIPTREVVGHANTTGEIAAGVPSPSNLNS